MAILPIATALAAALALDADTRAAAAQAWPAFVLVTGLLLIGLVADEDGLFDWAAAQLARMRASPRALFLCSLAAIAVVTALLNLDTAVVFMTPLVIYLARRAGADEQPFLYGSVFMANASSLFLPGSNLTNLLVLEREPVSGGTFALRMLPASLTAAVVTAALLVVMFRRSLRGAAPPLAAADAARPGPIGIVGTVAAAALTVTLHNPAPAVLGLGIALVGAKVATGRLTGERALDAVSPLVTLGLFAAAVALGTLARTWSGPSELVSTSGEWATAGLGATASIALNNLPAAVLLSAGRIAHPRALLIGLNIGPNLAVTGSLCAYLWRQSAVRAGADPSFRTFSRRGIPLALAAGAAAVVALQLVSAPRL